MSNVGRKFSWSWFLGGRSQVYKEKENFVVAGFDIVSNSDNTVPTLQRRVALKIDLISWGPQSSL